MNGFDIAAFAVLLVAFLLGLASGLVRIALTIVSVLVGSVVAVAYAETAARLLGRWVHAPELALLLGFVAVFAAVLVVFALATWLVRRLVQRLGLGWVDRSLGGLASLAVVLGAAMAGALVLQQVAADAKMVRSSRVLPALAAAGERGLHALPESWRVEAMRLLAAARERAGRGSGHPRPKATPPTSASGEKTK